MESANLGVVLDSSIMIEAERQRLHVASFLKYIASQIGERQAALCSISVADLAHGIHRADTPIRRRGSPCLSRRSQGHPTRLSDHSGDSRVGRSDQRRILPKGNYHSLR